MNEPNINGPRQERVIETLLQFNEITPKELGEIIGALNPRHHIMELRRQGFAGIICTKRFAITDRDGRRCFPGCYFIPSEHREKATEALERAKSARPAASGQATTNPARLKAQSKSKSKK